MSVLSLPHNLHAAAFNAIADEYDRVFTYSQIGHMQRQQVWRVLDRTFTSGQRVLELGCGTGFDAAHLAKRGVSVVACDESPAMVKVARTRARGEGCGDKLSFQVCANEELMFLREGEVFDGAFSNFGSLNCSADLPLVVEALTDKVRPGGRVILCMINRFCLWEMFWYLLKGNVAKAFRRIRKQGATAQFGRAKIQVFYPSLAKLRRIFAPHFDLVGSQGIGVAVPPSYVENIFVYQSKSLKLLGVIDRLVQRLPVARTLGDHILLEFVRKGS